MFYVEHAVTGLVEVSVTEKECVWNIPKAVKTVRMSSVRSIDFQTPASMCKKARHAEAAVEPPMKKKQKYNYVPPPTRAEKSTLIRELAKHSEKMENPIAAVAVSEEFAELSIHGRSIHH